LSQESATALGGHRAQMRRQIVDRASERASGCCLDQVSLELPSEVASNALDQASPVLAQGFRLGRSSAYGIATGEVPNRGLRCSHRLTGAGELVELSQELFDDMCNLDGGFVALVYARAELSLRFVQPLHAGERFALLDESLCELVDGALGDGDVSCGLRLSPFEVCYGILALAQPHLRTLEFLLERGYGRVKRFRVR
jgi:hypothetical protein